MMKKQAVQLKQFLFFRGCLLLLFSGAAGTGMLWWWDTFTGEVLTVAVLFVLTPQYSL
jgi:hypothetical protein